MFKLSQSRREFRFHNKLVSLLSNRGHDRMILSNNYTNASKMLLQNLGYFEINDNFRYNVFEMLKCKSYVEPNETVLDHTDVALIELIERKKELGKNNFIFLIITTNLITFFVRRVN